MNCYEFNNNCNELNELQVYAMVCLCLCYELLYVCFFFFVCPQELVISVLHKSASDS